MAWTLIVEPEDLALVRRGPRASIPAWVWQGPLAAVMRTPHETTLITRAAAVPPDEPVVHRGWRALRV
ncbi:MAG: hypothetical protein GXO36_06775, partial [Chloroflexi bacterium]|nr:hypothetical protein [Chloroflexota bacterium]